MRRHVQEQRAPTQHRRRTTGSEDPEAGVRDLRSARERADARGHPADHSGTEAVRARDCEAASDAAGSSVRLRARGDRGTDRDESARDRGRGPEGRRVSERIGPNESAHAIKCTTLRIQKVAGTIRSMNATLLVPLIIALAGALTYAFAGNAKLVELARITFFVGLLWTVYEVAAHVVHF